MRYKDAQKLASQFYRRGLSELDTFRNIERIDRSRFAYKQAEFNRMTHDIEGWDIDSMKASHRADKRRLNNLQSEFNRLVDEASPHNVNIERSKVALKGYVRSYSISVVDSSDPLAQLIKARDSTTALLNKTLKSLGGFQFIETLKIKLKKSINNEDGATEYTDKTAYFNSKAQTIINVNQINNSLNMSHETISNTIGVWLSEGSGWTVESVEGHYVNIAKYKPLRGSSYIELPKELRNSKKGLINLKNKDKKCFRWCHIRHLNPQDKHVDRIKGVDMESSKN